MEHVLNSILGSLGSSLVHHVHVHVCGVLGVLGNSRVVHVH